MDNYDTFAEAMKPPARKGSGRKTSKAQLPCKRKQNRMKSSNDHIPRKWEAVYNDKSNEDSEHYSVEARDENNPLDM